MGRCPHCGEEGVSAEEEVITPPQFHGPTVSQYVCPVCRTILTVVVNDQ